MAVMINFIWGEKETAYGAFSPDFKSDTLKWVVCVFQKHEDDCRRKSGMTNYH